MPDRSPLAPEEILELDEALIKAYRSHLRLRNRYPAAAQIQFPPIPAVLSESLVAAGVQHILGPGWTASYGGRVSDLVATKRRHRPVWIEVKATGSSQFQEFKPKDLDADLLVWLNFGPRYQDGAGPLEIYCLRKPGKLFPAARRLLLSRFVEIASTAPSATFWKLTFADVSDMLAVT